jgi:hypothetical protein
MSNKTGKETFVKGLTLFEVERMRKEKELSNKLKNDKPDLPYRTKKFPYKKKKIKKI